MIIPNINIPQFDYISEPEFAALMGRSLRTIRRWAVERKGPRRTRLGKTIYFSKAAIRQFLEQQAESES